jgi:5-oxoprolinase (ATP-hydrolysing)/N-methylhydantoinase A
VTSPAPLRYRCAFDIGGTFTDFVLLDTETGRIQIHKCLTTPEDPAIGSMAGLDELLGQAGTGFGDLDCIVHGSTIVTNLLIERKGARTALLTTRGFRDTLELGTEQRYDIHDLFLKFPPPLVPRELRFEIAERISRDGQVLRPLDMAEVHRAAAAAVAAGARALAVMFLHSYRNDAHERAVGRHVRREFPQLYVTLSCEVGGEIREYERATTTTANAYAQPLVDPYISNLESGLRARGFSGQFFMMQSSGTLASADMARRLPVRLLESGPAGGGLAAAHFGKAIGHDNLIAFDMGGTTAKVCLIQNGRPDVAPMLEAAREHRFTRGSGLPIRAPVIDLIEIGAGGGSIARIDEIGLLKVGPHSSGAMPGPACYGRGGTQPTVTDANLALGYLAAGSFLGGRMKLDTAAAETALGTLGANFGMSVEQAAWGIFSVVCENMAGAARVHVVEKGRDPRSFAMIAFGGAGPAHATRVAKSLGVRSVVIPPASGAASALGFLAGPVAHEAVRSAPGPLGRMDWDAVNAVLGELEAEGRGYLTTAEVAPALVSVQREVELRLLGQLHNLRVAVPGGRLDAGVGPHLRAAFSAAFRNLYAREAPAGELEIISWRVTCKGPAAALRATPEAPVEGGAALRGERPVWFPEAGGFVATGVYSRYALRPGTTVAGPAIVEENESTTVIAPGDTLLVDAHGNLVVTVALAGDGAVTHQPARNSRSEQLIAQIEADPVGLEIMWSRLITISEECWLTVIRTAFSLIIGEAQDFACEILDAEGQSLAHSPRAMPVFNISLMTAVNEILKVYPSETLGPGDVLITNDPWICAGHLFDIAIVTPVFRHGKVVAFIGSVGHVSDIGGTKDRGNARELYDEGLQIPPMKLYDRGQSNRDLFRMLHANVRNAAQVVGDVEALVAANELGAERLAAFMAEYRFESLVELATVIQGRAERAVRQAIQRVPNGVYESRSVFTAAGQELWVPARITVADEAIEVDYAGAPPQSPRGGINCTMTVTRAETLFALKCLFSPGIRATAGCYRPFTVRAPEGSLFNCSKPAAVGLRRLSMWQFVGTIFRALGEAMPEAVQAFTALPSLVDIYGSEDGRVYSDHVFLGGGQGGSARQDGKSGLIWPTSAANTSIEMAEARMPVLIEAKRLLADTAGAGRQRGGLAQMMRFRRLNAAGGPLFINIYPDGRRTTTGGLQGGGAGGRTQAFLRNEKTGEMREYLEGIMLQIDSVDAVVDVTVGGGAGFGNPAERVREAVERDLAEGYITPEGAKAYRASGDVP